MQKSLLRKIRINQPTADNLRLDSMQDVKTSSHLLVTVGGEFTIGAQDKQEVIILKASQVSLPLSALRVPKVSAWLWTAFHRRHFTEYALPFLIASSPIVWQIWHWLAVA